MKPCLWAPYMYIIQIIYVSYPGELPGWLPELSTATLTLPSRLVLRKDDSVLIMQQFHKSVFDFLLHEPSWLLEVEINHLA